MGRYQMKSIQVFWNNLLYCLQIDVVNIKEALVLVVELEEGEPIHHNIGNLQQAGGLAQLPQLGG